jgi:hypothetical protein
LSCQDISGILSDYLFIKELALSSWFAAFPILFRFARRLLSSGTLPPEAAVGCPGTVHLTIPAGGTGRVGVRIGQRARDMDAVHAGRTALPTGTPIRVLRVERSLAVVRPLAAREAPFPVN